MKKTGRNAPDRGSYRYKGPGRGEGSGQHAWPSPDKEVQSAQPRKEAMWIVGKEGSGNGRKSFQKPEGNVSERES